jgi:hypothetical protein
MSAEIGRLAAQKIRLSKKARASGERRAAWARAAASSSVKARK